MDYQEGRRRLQNYAGSLGCDFRAEVSFLGTAYQTDRTGVPLDFQPLYEDVLVCLTAVNLSLNGPVPSESLEDTGVFDRQLCGSIASILSQGWDCHFRWAREHRFADEFLYEFASLLVRVGIAWGMVLDGDFDDLPSEVESEFIARQA